MPATPALANSTSGRGSVVGIRAQSFAGEAQVRERGDDVVPERRGGLRFSTDVRTKLAGG
jgi:hypothetical protein